MATMRPLAFASSSQE